MIRGGRGFHFVGVIALLFLVAGCATERQKRAFYGATLGAGIGAAAGTGISDDDNEAAIGVGAGVGALVGAVLGYYSADDPPPPPPPPEPKVIILRGINFDFDESDVKLEFEPVLDEAAQILQDNQDCMVLIEGHTDSMGSESYNQGLSENRAAAVKAYLVGKGIGADRLETVGRGENDPVAPNTNDNGTDNAEGRGMNRRAELIVQ